MGGYAQQIFQLNKTYQIEVQEDERIKMIPTPAGERGRKSRFYVSSNIFFFFFETNIWLLNGLVCKNTVYTAGVKNKNMLNTLEISLVRIDYAPWV